MPSENFELERLQTRDIELEATREIGPRPATRAGYASPVTEQYVYADSLEGEEFHLRQLWRMARKHLWLVFSITVIATSLVALNAFRIRSTYEASATIEVRKENPALAKSSNVVIQTDDSSDINMDMLLKTQMVLLKSRPLLETVVANLKLDESPKFLDVNQSGLFSEAFDAVIKTPRGSSDTPEAHAQVQAGAALPDEPASDAEQSPRQSFAESERLAPYVSVLKDNMDVDQINDTRILRIAFTHTDPATAAVVANGIADEFVQQNFQTKTERFTKASAWLEEATRKLKARVEEDEKAFADYTRDHSIFSTEGTGTLTIGTLTTLHAQLMRATMDAMLKRSLYEEVMAGRVAQLPEAYSDARMVELQKEINKLAVEAAQVSLDYGSDNPRVKEVQQKMVTIQGQINANTKSLETKLKTDYERAVRDEQSISAALEQAKNRAVNENEANIRYGVLKQEMDTARALYREFLEKTGQANMQVAEQQSNLRLVEPARVPKSPVGPKRMQAIFLAFVVSLAAGIGLAFFLEYLDNTIKTVEDVTRYVQLPALGVIPMIQGRSQRLLSGRIRGKKARRKQIPALSQKLVKSAPNTSEDLLSPDPAQGTVEASNDDMSGITPEGLVMLDNRSSAAEAFRVLRTSVLLSTAGSPPKTIQVTSSEPGEGKTTTLINTAISLAQLGASVLIIDADLRRPTVHRIFGTNQEPGLSTYLSSNIEIDGLIQNLQIPNLSLLPCGLISPNPAELIGSTRMKNLLRLLSERYDHILIDCPPLANMADSIILSTLVDGVILVVHGNKSNREVVRRARHELLSVGAKIFGVVLNNVSVRHDGYKDYYPE